MTSSVKAVVYVALCGALFGYCDATAGQVSNDELLKVCAKKTRVYATDGNGVQVVGEGMDSFCKGFLQGVVEHFITTAKSCNGGVDTDSEYVLSILKKYIEDKKFNLSDSASNTLDKALRRAYQCE